MAAVLIACSLLPGTHSVQAAPVQAAPVQAAPVQAAPVQATPRQVTVVGSTTLQPLVKRIAREFMKDHPGPPIVVSGGGSGEGVGALLRGEADIANSSRFVTEQELDQAMGSGIYPVPFRIANDSIIPIVHNTNRIKNLTQEELKRIYRGEISNWRELGGSDLGIEAFSRPADSGTFGVWHEIVMAREKMAAGVRRAQSSGQMVKAVSNARGAIGYISLGHLSASVKPLRVNGVMGSIYMVRNGTYILSRPLFMFTRGWPRGRVLELINYALSPDKGQAIAQKSGLIPFYRYKNH